MSTWQKWRRAILGTIGAAGVWLAAMLSVQQPVVLPPLPIQQVSEQVWIFTNDYRVTVSNWVVTIKAGFRCDLASIPDQAQGPLGLTRDAVSLRRAAAVHDALYASRLLPRDTSDACLLIIALQDGTDPAKAQAVWEAVSLWGFIPWDRHTTESVWEAGKYVTITER